MEIDCTPKGIAAERVRVLYWKQGWRPAVYKSGRRNGGNMVTFLEGHFVFFALAVSFLLLSIVCRFLTGMRLKKLIRDAAKLSATENILLKQCRLKFQSCYELNGGVVNTGVFVEKFIQGIRLGRFSLRFWEMAAGQFLLLSVLADGLGACIGIAAGESSGDVLPFYLLAVVSLFACFSAAGIIDTAGKREILKTTLEDFLENRMAVRLDGVKKDKVCLEEQEKKISPAVSAAGEAGRESEAEKDELEKLLREFLA